MIGEAARTSGTSPRSLRFYEDEGLIVAGRRGNGYRDYCRSTIDRVLLIRSLLASGLSVKLIRDVLAHDPGADFLDEVQGYRDRLADRIAALTAQRSALDAFLDQARRA